MKFFNQFHFDPNAYNSKIRHKFKKLGEKYIKSLKKKQHSNLMYLKPLNNANHGDQII